MSIKPITQQELRSTVNGAYQIQKLRIQTGNRIVANFKVELGQKPGTTEELLEMDAKDLLELLRKEHKLITDGLVNFPTPNRFKVQHLGIIDNYTKLCLIDQYVSLYKAEKSSFVRIEHILKDFPIWTQYLKGVAGIGPAIAAILISEIDISKATYPTSLWRLAGLDVAWDNKGRSKRKAHLEDREYTKKSGKIGIKKSITYKPLLKTKLMGIAATSFIKVGDKSPYSKVYYDYKRRLENHPIHRDRFIGINVAMCKESLGVIPKTIVTRAFMSDMYCRCQEQVNLTMPDLEESNVKKETQKLIREILGPYEIYEHLLEREVVTDEYTDKESIENHVKSIGGVLRAPKEIDVFIDEEDAEDVAAEVGFQTVEEFDETPDGKGRPLYKLVNIGKSKNHRNMMAYRYIVKRFLADLYAVWRAMEGLEVMPEYAESKLGIIHGEASEGKRR